MRCLIAPVVRSGRALHTAGVYRWLLHCHSELAPTPAGSAVVFAPHQDDETLGCGGVIALKCRAGASVHVAVLTNGDGGGRRGRGDAETRGRGDTRTRDLEALEAAHALGLPTSAVHFFGYPDSQLRRLAGEPRRRFMEAIADLLRHCEPDEVYVPHRSDGHADHEAAYRLVLEAVAQVGRAVEVFEYPVWLTWLSVSGLGIGIGDYAGAVRIPIQSVLEVKQRAVRQYRSQTQTFPAGFLCRFLQPYEVYFRSIYPTVSSA